MSAILSFLGGGAFRAIWGEASAYLNKKQDHNNEIAMLTLQAKHAGEEHARNMEGQRLLSQLGIEASKVEIAQHTASADDDAFLELQRGMNVKSGVAIIDGWNAAIRPAFATLVLIGMGFELYMLHWIFNDWYREFAGVVVGMYFADRSLKHRGK